MTTATPKKVSVIGSFNDWNEKATPIIRELHAPIIRNKRSIVIVSNHTQAGDLPEKEDDSCFEDVFLVRGDPASETVLKRAEAQPCRSQ